MRVRNWKNPFLKRGQQKHLSSNKRIVLAERAGGGREGLREARFNSLTLLSCKKALREDQLLTLASESEQNIAFSDYAEENGKPIRLGNSYNKRGKLRFNEPVRISTFSASVKPQFKIRRKFSLYGEGILTGFTESRIN